jgi:hypothetical protein
MGRNAPRPTCGSLPFFNASETSDPCATQGVRPSLARLHVNRWVSPRQVRPSKKWGHTVKKLLVLALIALGGLLIWRKVQADRAELDLWTEATGSEN